MYNFNYCQKQSGITICKTIDFGNENQHLFFFEHFIDLK